MSGNELPDSWDDGATGLNINAAVFVPGQNIHAREFVPFGAPSTVPNGYQNQQEPSAGDVHPNQQKLVEGMEAMEISAPEPTAANGMDVDQKEVKEEIPDDWAVDDGGEEETEDSEEGGSEEESKRTAKARQRVISAGDAKKEHLNVVFIGHVDAGKSTMGGQIMYLTGMVDKRTLEKYEREAKEKNRETWFWSWALDTNLEEREKGKTVDVGRAYFETEKKHFTILDAPGHKGFVPNMIGGASQADIAVLVISARKGEFETGFDRGGQTREHAMLVKTAGVKKLIIAVNKMDDPTVGWSEARYLEIQDKLTPFLKKCGFNPKTDMYYLPVSGFTGANIKENDPVNCPWYSGQSLIDYMDGLPPMPRQDDGPIRLPVASRYKDMGTIVIGKVESGMIKKGMTLTIMPNKMSVEVLTMWSDEDESEEVGPGENVKVKLKNVEEEDVALGFVLCSPNNLCHVGKVFDAQVVILEHDSIICAGYSAIMHMFTIAEDVTITHLICTVDKKTGEKSKTRPKFIKQDTIAIVRLEVANGNICLETFKDFQPMGRFTLRDKTRTVAIGKVLKVIA